ncbi:hypothetical protein Moror_8495, partial [Moniliophthora roreri MCA 2997]
MIKDAVIYKHDLEFVFISTFKDEDIEIKLELSDHTLSVTKKDDLEDADPNTFFYIGNGNRNHISSFYNPFVPPTPPPEVKRWEEEHKYDYKCNQADYYD